MAAGLTQIGIAKFAFENAKLAVRQYFEPCASFLRWLLPPAEQSSPQKRIELLETEVIELRNTVSGWQNTDSQTRTQLRELEARLEASERFAHDLDDRVRKAADAREHEPAGMGTKTTQVLTEPIMRVEIEAPEEFTGTLIGDLNARRGRIQGIEPRLSAAIISAQVPMAEMLGYSTQLSAMTEGKGTYRMEMDHYDVVPQRIAEEILAGRRQPIEAEEE